MDILVSIPLEQEEHVRATKLNPIGGLTHGFWTLSGNPRYAKAGDRIWFSLLGDVIASAQILDPQGEFPAGGHHEDDVPEDGKYKPAICFGTVTVLGHDFPAPAGLPLGFREFRYVRRTAKYKAARYTRALELVSAKKAQRLYPKNW